MIRLLALVFMLLPLAVRAEVYPALYDVTGVAAGDVLNLRAAPNAESAIIATLAPEATGVEVVAVQDGWALVNTPEATGYASLRFLARQPGPDWSEVDRPLHCLGTEPFWDLAVVPETRTAWLTTPEQSEPEALAMGQVWPALPWSPVAAFAIPDGFVALSPVDCSDGMSDRRYGIAVDIFLSRADRSRLSGCCALSLP